MERSLVRPSFTIVPLWGESTDTDNPIVPDWNGLNVPSPLPLEISPVNVDETSATLLGLIKPKNMRLLEFLQKLDDDEADRPLWIVKFLDSLDATIRGSIYDQQITYFRHHNGRILRPIIDSISRSKDGSHCECHAIFVDAFNTPPGTHPSPTQLLANGVRLGTRVRIEVLDKYLNRMNLLYEKKTTDPESDRWQFPVGEQLVESMDLILQEAKAQNLDWEGDPPALFNKQGDQERYEKIRHQFQMIYPKLHDAAKNGDKNRPTPNYDSAHEWLRQIDKLNRDYMGLVLPRFMEVFDAPQNEVD
jgi:hypothetical protein